MFLQEIIDLELQKAMDYRVIMKLSQRQGLKYLFYDDIKETDTLKSLLPKPVSGVLIMFVKHDQRNFEKVSANEDTFKKCRQT